MNKLVIGRKKFGRLKFDRLKFVRLKFVRLGATQRKASALYLWFVNPRLGKFVILYGVSYCAAADGYMLRQPRCLGGVSWRRIQPSCSAKDLVQQRKDLLPESYAPAISEHSRLSLASPSHSMSIFHAVRSCYLGWPQLVGQ
jgi:hypothetical protein